MKFEFERIDDGHARAKVFGGWLVKAYDVEGEERYGNWRTAMTFIPDAGHEWEIDQVTDGVPGTTEHTPDAVESVPKFEKTMVLLYDWAMIWHRQAGGYMASDTSLLITRAEKYINQMIDNNTDFECFRPKTTEHIPDVAEPEPELKYWFVSDREPEFYSKVEHHPKVCCADTIEGAIKLMNASKDEVIRITRDEHEYFMDMPEGTTKLDILKGGEIYYCLSRIFVKCLGSDCYETGIVSSFFGGRRWVK